MKPKLIDQNIFDELDLGNLSEKQKEQLLLNWTDKTMQITIMRILATLPKEKQAEFNMLMDNPSEEKFGQFIKDNVLNFDVILDEETLKFKKALVEKFGQQS